MSQTDVCRVLAAIDAALLVYQEQGEVPLAGDELEGRRALLRARRAMTERLHALKGDLGRVL